MLQRLVDAAAVAAEIARVRSLSGGALRRRWQAVFGRPPPEQLTADLLRRMIANRVQEEAFGTLDRATLKLLDGLARRDGSRPAERNLKVGTVLVRDYRGRRHTVTVAPEGYVWEGQPYSSLSAVARAITGTAWSGPRFFALKSSGERSSGPSDAAHHRGTARHHSQSQSSAGATLHYPYEVRNSKDCFADIPELTPAPELLRLAEHILDGKLQAFDPSGFRDRYEEALMAHLKAKQAGLPPQPKQSWAVPRRAINLMEALRRSIASDNKLEAPHRAPPVRKRA